MTAGKAGSGRRPGLTLLEVMIALAFIGIALIAVIRLQTQGVRLADQARFTARAVFLAQYALEEAQAERALTSGVAEDAFPEPLDGIRWRREISAVPLLTGLYKIQVWVHLQGADYKTGLTLTGLAYRGQP